MIVTAGSLIPGRFVQGAPDPDGLVASNMIRVVDIETGEDLVTCLEIDTDTGEAKVFRRNSDGFPVYEDGRLAMIPHPHRVMMELRPE